MDFYEAVYQRKAVREFQDKKVDFGAVNRILEAGNRAPTWNHKRKSRNPQKRRGNDAGITRS